MIKVIVMQSGQQVYHLPRINKHPLSLRNLSLSPPHPRRSSENIWFYVSEVRKKLKIHLRYGLRSRYIFLQFLGKCEIRTNRKNQQSKKAKENMQDRKRSSKLIQKIHNLINDGIDIMEEIFSKLHIRFHNNTFF